MERGKKAISKKLNHLKSEHPSYRIPRTIGQRASDSLTKWAGSWVFIITVSVLLFIWMVVNTSWLIFGRSWDPYPFILLNFILSTLAALQAPIILMSQVDITILS